MRTALQQAFARLEELHPSLFDIHTEKGRTFVNEFTKFLEVEREQILDSRLDGFKNSAEGWNGEYPFEGMTDYYISLDIKNDDYYNETFKPE